VKIYLADSSVWRWGCSTGDSHNSFRIWLALFLRSFSSILTGGSDTVLYSVGPRGPMLLAGWGNPVSVKVILNIQLSTSSLIMQSTGRHVALRHQVFTPTSMMQISDTVDSSIFVSVNFRELPETKMFVDIWICGFDTSLVIYEFRCALNFVVILNQRKQRKLVFKE